MPWRDAVQPVAMRRVAVVAPRESLRDALVRVADAGVVELQRLTGPGEVAPGDAGRRLQRAPAPAGAVAVARSAPDLAALERAGRVDLLAGEAQVEERAAEAVSRRSVTALVGWAPAEALTALAGRLAEVGAAVVPLPRPRGAEPPTLLRREGRGRAFAPVVETYASVPYDDIDPTPFAALAYVVMFGLMFGDAGHGLLLILLSLLIRAGRPRRLARLRRAWPFVAGAGVVSTLTGVAYGEFFGPTGVLPVRWIDPLEQPVQLLLAAVGLGVVLLAVAYAIGTVNRVREGGWAYALYAPSGIAGATVFLGAGLIIGGGYGGLGWVLLAGAVVAAVGLVLSFVGLRATAGPGGAGWVQASVELFDLVVRLGSNVVSFARLAAFGLTHAALTTVVWDGTAGLWARGGPGAVAAVLVFTVGNALAFTLEALVAGVQALRLEYYELFSRVFVAEGRPFQPWHVPAVDAASDGEGAR